MTVTVEVGYDASQSGALGITLTEIGGGGSTVPVSLTGTYMPITDLTLIDIYDEQGYGGNLALGYASMQSALKSALETAGTAPATYTCTLSPVTKKWTITASGGGVTSITLAFDTNAQRYFGFGASVSGALSYTATSQASRYIVPAENGITDFRQPYDVVEDLAADIVSAGGTHEGVAQRVAIQRVEMTFPLEPAKSVWITAVSTSEYSWEHLFRQARNVEPISITDVQASTVSTGIVMRLAADSCAFNPELLSAEYFAYANIKLSGYVLGYIP